MDFILKLLGFYKAEVIPMVSPMFKNDSERLKNEYNALIDKNKDLYDAINDLALFMRTKLNKSLIITMIYRTDEEQAEIYKNSPKYKEKPFKSPHQFWQAWDTHSLDLSTAQISTIVDYLNQKYNETNYYSVTCMYHEIDNLGYHLHSQFIKKTINK